MNKIDVRVGDTVMISSGGGRSLLIYEAEVVKIARMWITVMTAGAYPHEEKFRLGDQTSGPSYGYGTRFYTLGQWAAKKRDDEAADFLREQGITIEFRSAWRGRSAELADLIRAATEAK